MDGILQSLPWRKIVQQRTTFLCSNLPRSTHSVLRFARFHISLVNPHPYCCKWLTRSEMWLKEKTQSWLVSLGFLLCICVCMQHPLFLLFVKRCVTDLGFDKSKSMKIRTIMFTCITTCYFISSMVLKCSGMWLWNTLPLMHLKTLLDFQLSLISTV